MENNSSLMQNFDSSNPVNFFSVKFLTIIAITILLGVGSGFLLARLSPNLLQNTYPGPKEKSAIEKGKIYGSSDTSAFKDTAEGIMKEGGIDGEGQFHLERPGGASQNVYLTSSLVDLSLFAGQRIKVWGETQKAQKAGWLMDVGRIEVL